MVAIKNKTERVRNITRLVSKLTAKEQEVLMKQLERKLMLEKASALDGLIKENPLTMSGIVNEVRKVRAKR